MSQLFEHKSVWNSRIYFCTSWQEDVEYQDMNLMSKLQSDWIYPFDLQLDSLPKKISHLRTNRTQDHVRFSEVSVPVCVCVCVCVR